MKRKTDLSGIAVIVFFLVGSLVLFASCGNFDYSITIDGPFRGGRIAVQGGLDGANAGEIITLIATPDFAHDLSYITVNDVMLDVNVFTFTMPNEDVVIRAQFVSDDKYASDIFALLDSRIPFGDPTFGEAESFEGGAPGQSFASYGRGYFVSVTPSVVWANGTAPTANAFFDNNHFPPPHVWVEESQLAIADRPTLAQREAERLRQIADIGRQSGRMDFNLGSGDGVRTARFGKYSYTDTDLRHMSYNTHIRFHARATVPGRYSVVIRMDVEGKIVEQSQPFTITAANTWQEFILRLARCDDFPNLHPGFSNLYDGNNRAQVYCVSYEASSASGFANANTRSGSLWIDYMRVTREWQ
jgi:hypothetical protein